MERVAYLEAVVTTGYTEQRRGDITGAVGSVPVETINRETGASVLQKLAAATPGRHGRGERLAGFAEHGPHPRHQLVPEQ